MRNASRSFAQLTAATALMLGTVTFCVLTPANSIPQQNRTAASLLVFVGCVLAPAGLIVGAARDAQA